MCLFYLSASETVSNLRQWQGQFLTLKLWVIIDDYVIHGVMHLQFSLPVKFPLAVFHFVKKLRS